MGLILHNVILVGIRPSEKLARHTLRYRQCGMRWTQIIASRIRKPSIVSAVLGIDANVSILIVEFVELTQLQVILVKFLSFELFWCYPVLIALQVNGAIHLRQFESAVFKPAIWSWLWVGSIMYIVYIELPFDYHLPICDFLLIILNLLHHFSDTGYTRYTLILCINWWWNWIFSELWGFKQILSSSSLVGDTMDDFVLWLDFDFRWFSRTCVSV